MVAAVKGYPLVLVMPESMSVERRRIMAAYGASLELTPKETGDVRRHRAGEGTAGGDAGRLDAAAVREPRQSRDASDGRPPARSLRDFPEGLDYLITGVGTGGHITGVAEILKTSMPRLIVFAVEPAKSPVLSGGAPGPHRLQGIGAGLRSRRAQPRGAGRRGAGDRGGCVRLREAGGPGGRTLRRSLLGGLTGRGRAR